MSPWSRCSAGAGASRDGSAGAPLVARNRRPAANRPAAAARRPGTDTHRLRKKGKSRHRTRGNHNPTPAAAPAAMEPVVEAAAKPAAVEAAMKPATGKPAMEAPMESTGAAHATMESATAHAAMAHATMAHTTHTLSHCRRGCQGKDG